MGTERELEEVMQEISECEEEIQTLEDRLRGLVDQQLRLRAKLFQEQGSARLS